MCSSYFSQPKSKGVSCLRSIQPVPPVWASHWMVAPSQTSPDINRRAVVHAQATPRIPVACPAAPWEPDAFLQVGWLSSINSILSGDTHPLGDQDLLQTRIPCDQLSWTAQESNKCYTFHYCFKDLFYCCAKWVFLGERFARDACSLHLSKWRMWRMLFANGDTGDKSILWHPNSGKIIYGAQQHDQEAEERLLLPWGH